MPKPFLYINLVTFFSVCQNSTIDSQERSFGLMHSTSEWSLGLEQRGVGAFVDQKWTPTYAVRVEAKNEKENSCWGGGLGLQKDASRQQEG